MLSHPENSSPETEPGNSVPGTNTTLMEISEFDKDRFQLALESARVGTWDFDPVSGKLTWDERCKVAFGLAPDATVDYGVFLAGLHPDDRERSNTAVECALRGDNGGMYDIEYRTISPLDGRVRWIAATGRAFLDAQGRAERFIGTVIDITNSKQAEAELHERNERFQAVARATRDVVWDWNLATDAVWWNEGIHEVFGYAQGEVRYDATWWYEHIHPDDRDRVVHGIHEVIDGHAGDGHSWSDEYRYRRADGTFADILDRGYVVRDAAGTVLRMIGAMLDQSKQKMLELEREGLLAEASARAEREALLNRISAVTRATSDPDEVQAKALSLLAEARNLDHCLFVVREPSRTTWRITVDWHRATLTPMTEAFRQALGRGLVQETFLDGHTTVSTDVAGSPFLPAEVREALVQNGYGSFLMVPLQDNGRPVAGLAVGMRSPRTWTAEEISLIEEVATLVRASADAARTQLRERTIASRLQDALQPPTPPVLPGLKLANYYRPALDEADVGGDFHDVFSVEKGCTALVVADLSGKGLAAAQQVATVRNMLRFALYNGNSVSGAVSTLHETLVEQNLLSGFATLFVGMYDHAQRTLTYVNCGQESGLIWRVATGDVDELEPTGPILGGFGPGNYEQKVASLAEGDVLTLFTDGLTEVGPNRKELLEIAGVKKIVQQCCSSKERGGCNPDVLVPNLIAQVDAFARGGARDDIALLVGVVTDGK